MARKDASAVQAPVDQYRKQIGKQDWKKSKKEVKAQKRAADQQSSFGIVGVLLIVVALLGLVVGLYGFLVWSLDKSVTTDTSEQRPG